MKLYAPAIAMAGLLLQLAPAAAAGTPAPSPGPDPVHPVVMQQAATAMATAPAATHRAATPRVAAVNQAATNANLRREVFGFALASSLSDPTVGYPSWNFSLLTTVAFFGLHINDDGTIASDSGLTVWNSAQLTDLLTAAHASGTKVVVTIIEQDFTPNTPHICAALTNRATTVSQTVAQVTAMGVDGVNIDFEGLNGNCPNGQTARSMMTDLAQQLRASLPAGSYLTVDTYASSAADPLGFFDVPGLGASVDAFFVMAYDLEYSNYARAPAGCASFCLGPTAPLSGYYYTDTTTSSQYAAVVPASKVILGVPYYGRKSCVAGAAANAYPTGAVAADTYLDASTEASAPEVQAGSHATHRDANDPGGSERWDTWFNTTLGCTRELYWDDTVSLGLKYDLVNRDGLRGAGIWNLNYGGGAPELWAAISSHFEGCSSAMVTESPASPQLSGVPIQISASSTGCTNPRYEFWLLPAGGAWSVVQGYSAASTYNWVTTGDPAGSYHFSIWVRDANSAGLAGSAPNTYDSFGAFDFMLTTAQCSAVTTTSAPASTASAGTAVTVTAGATGCSNARYEFWLLQPGVPWTVVQAYSTTSSLGWSTAGKPAGAYRFSVWARDTSSTAAYDAFDAFQYPLTVPSCSAITAPIAPATSTSIGTPVTISAGATGCPNPRYEIWLLPPGGVWTLVQPYSAGGTFNWSTAGWAPGSYRFSVWARDAGSPLAYDSFAAFQYSLMVTPCTAMTGSAAPLSTATVGTQVTVTGAATGCTNPQYEFWLKLPDGTWTLVQPYSSNTMFTWTTTGHSAGAYRFSVWARDASSPAPYDVFGAFQYPLS